MGRWLPKEQRLELGEKVAHLRDVEKLQWKDIAERLDLFSGTNAVYHYKKHKALLLTVKSEMSLKQIEEFSCRYGIERGWCWLYENGFKRRVPLEIQEKIELAKMGVSSPPPLVRVRIDRRKLRRGRPKNVREARC